VPFLLFFVKCVRYGASRLCFGASRLCFGASRARWALRAAALGASRPRLGASRPESLTLMVISAKRRVIQPGGGVGAARAALPVWEKHARMA
jgi:hypothetical protein